jgi:DNA-binding NtrC family response regulator
VQDISARLKKSITGVSPAAERLLQEAPWPGNIRELRNVVERACLLSDTRILTEREISAAMPGSAPREPAAVRSRPAPTTGAERGQLRIAERAQIERTLQQVGGNKAEAARLLGVSHNTVHLTFRKNRSPPAGLFSWCDFAALATALLHRSTFARLTVYFSAASFDERPLSRSVNSRVRRSTWSH